MRGHPTLEYLEYIYTKVTRNHRYTLSTILIKKNISEHRNQFTVKEQEASEQLLSLRIPKRGHTSDCELWKRESQK